MARKSEGIIFTRISWRKRSRPLDRFFTNLGAKMEKRRRDKGVYPPKEIHTPTPAESQQALPSI